MRLFNSIKDLRPQNGACATIGNFDGAHLGHQSLISLAKRLASKKSLDFILITFWPHPRLALANSPGHMALSSREERLRLLAEAGPDIIVELPFNLALASLSPEEFVDAYLLPLQMRELVVGHDFTLGKDRRGNVAFLRELAQKRGFGITQAPALMLDGAPVSSTLLRQHIKNGEVSRAARLLGRPYRVCGKVVHGQGRGTGLGFPTANLGEYETLLPGNGVYAAFALCEGAKYRAVTNIGHNPTFNGQQISVESFLLDCGANLYGKNLCLEFVEFLRGEKKFPTVEDLKAQIARDAKRAADLLATLEGDFPC